MPDPILSADFLEDFAGNQFNVVTETDPQPNVGSIANEEYTIEAPDGSSPGLSVKLISDSAPNVPAGDQEFTYDFEIDQLHFSVNPNTGFIIILVPL